MRIKKMISIMISAVMVILSVSYSANIDYQLNANAQVILTETQIVNELLSKVDSSYDIDYCLRFVDEFWESKGGIHTHGCCAHTIGNSVITSTSIDNIPIGADVFFECNYPNTVCDVCGNICGHIGIYIGNGYMVEASNGTVNKTSLDYFNRGDWSFRGWGIHYGVSIQGPEGYLTAPFDVILSKNQYWYDLKDSIKLTATAKGAYTYWISVLKNGKSVINQEMPTGVLSISAAELGYGDYHAWISAVNDKGSVDSNHLDFSIVPAPSYTNLYTSKDYYSINDDVSIGVNSFCCKGQVIGIDKEGKGRVITEECSNPFKISAKDLGVGNYSAYFSIYNGSGTTDTTRVTFSIYDKPPTWSKIEIEDYKEKYNIGDIITFKASSDSATQYWLGLDKDSSRYITEEMINEKHTITLSETGSYSAYVSAANDMGYIDSNSVKFDVYDSTTTTQKPTTTTTTSTTTTQKPTTTTTTSTTTTQKSTTTTTTSTTTTQKPTTTTTSATTTTITSKATNDKRYIGTWTAYAYSDYENAPKKDLSNESVSFILYDDMTGILFNFGGERKAELTWANESNDCITVNWKGDIATFNYSNDELVFKRINGKIYYFVKEYSLGDVNNDGQINAVDASTVLAYYAMISTNKDGGFNDNHKAAADVNYDSQINAVDASCILSYYAYVSTTREETKSIEEFLKK